MKLLLVWLFSHLVYSQVSEATVYWVGHSLMSGKDWSDPEARNLLELTGEIALSQGDRYSHYKHTTPGAPLGWNWGVADSWGDMEERIAPLIDSSHENYGSFDVIVLTEGVNIQSSYDWWSSGFYARKFYNAARKANPQTRLFLYESWHHYYASDFQNYYGDPLTFEWITYQKEMRKTWNKIKEEAADPLKTPTVQDYQFQGEGEDPGEGSDSLKVFMIPTGTVFVAVVERLLEQRPGDDWNFTRGINGVSLTPDDFFYNPYLNWPEDQTNTLRGEVVDDIHPSEVLIYLNSLVHYAVIYQKDPRGVAPMQGVPAGIAEILQEVTWEVVTSDPSTGLLGFGEEMTGVHSKIEFLHSQKKRWNAKGQRGGRGHFGIGPY